MTLKGKRLAFIGAGNMGSAILEGLLSQKTVEARNIIVLEKSPGTAESLQKKWAVGIAESAKEAADKTDIMLLAVKPQDLSAVSAEIRGNLRSSHILISVLAGITVQKLEESLGTQPRIVRSMPNLGALAGQSVTAVTGKDLEALETAEKIFSACGKAVRIEESFFDLVTALSGSGPAYFFLLMETLAEAGIKKGLDPKTSEVLAVQTAVGAALVAQNSSSSPAELRQMVTSKGGTTEAALTVLEENRFKEIFFKAIDAAERRGRELRGE